MTGSFVGEVSDAAKVVDANFVNENRETSLYFTDQDGLGSYTTRAARYPMHRSLSNTEAELRKITPQTDDLKEALDKTAEEIKNRISRCGGSCLRLASRDNSSNTCPAFNQEVFTKLLLHNLVGKTES